MSTLPSSSSEYRAAKCPNCGGDLRLQDSADDVTCRYCGNAIVVREAIRIAVQANIANLVGLADTAADAGNFQEAYNYYTKVLEHEANNTQAWFGKAVSAGWMSTLTDFRLPEMVSGIKRSLEGAADGEKPVLKSRAVTEISKIATAFYRVASDHRTRFLSDDWLEVWHDFLRHCEQALLSLDFANELDPVSRVPLDAGISIITQCIKQNRETAKLEGNYEGSLRSYAKKLRVAADERFKAHLDRFNSKLKVIDLDGQPPTPEGRPSGRSSRWTLMWVAVVIAGLGILAYINRSSLPFLAQDEPQQANPTVPAPTSAPSTPLKAAPPVDGNQPNSVIIQADAGTSPFTNSLGLKFIEIKAGEFIMGSPTAEAKRVDNETQHQVRITKPFFMATTTVTQQQWQSLMGTNPSHFKGDDLPVETVSWDDSVEFCRKLSEKEGKQYRLPTEAEWEYACRAGTQTKYFFGNYDADLADYAWFKANSEKTTHPVGSKMPNAWGLYDMHGNIFQWCSDYVGSYDGDSVDPMGPVEGDAQMRHRMRGGSWNSTSNRCRDAFRHEGTKDDKNWWVGFRVILVKEEIATVTKSNVEDQKQSDAARAEHERKMQDVRRELPGFSNDEDAEKVYDRVHHLYGQ